MYTFTRSINYDLNLFDTRQKRTTFRNHDRFESLWKHKWLSKPSRLKVLIILRSKRILLLKLYSFNVPIFSFTYVILSCVRLILKIPKIFQIAFRFSIDRRRYRNDLSGLLERRRHDCKSFSPDLFSRSCTYIYIRMYTAYSKLIFVSSASFLAGSFSPRACTRCWHGYKVTGEANRTSDESQLVEISSTNITRRALIALDGREAAALRREIAPVQPFYFAFLLARFSFVRRPLWHPFGVSLFFQVFPSSWKRCVKLIKMYIFFLRIICYE